MSDVQTSGPLRRQRRKRAFTPGSGAAGSASAAARTATPSCTIACCTARHAATRCVSGAPPIRARSPRKPSIRPASAPRSAVFVGSAGAMRSSWRRCPSWVCLFARPRPRPRPRGAVPRPVRPASRMRVCACASDHACTGACGDCSLTVSSWHRCCLDRLSGRTLTGIGEGAARSGASWLAPRCCCLAWACAAVPPGLAAAATSALLEGTPATPGTLILSWQLQPALTTRYDSNPRSHCSEIKFRQLQALCATHRMSSLWQLQLRPSQCRHSAPPPARSQHAPPCLDMQAALARLVRPAWARLHRTAAPHSPCPVVRQLVRRARSSRRAHASPALLPWMRSDGLRLPNWAPAAGPHAPGLMSPCGAPWRCCGRRRRRPVAAPRKWGLVDSALALRPPQQRQVLAQRASEDPGRLHPAPCPLSLTCPGSLQPCLMPPDPAPGRPAVARALTQRARQGSLQPCLMPPAPAPGRPAVARALTQRARQGSLQPRMMPPAPASAPGRPAVARALTQRARQGSLQPRLMPPAPAPGRPAVARALTQRARQGSLQPRLMPPAPASAPGRPAVAKAATQRAIQAAACPGAQPGRCAAACCSARAAPPAAHAHGSRPPHCAARSARPRRLSPAHWWPPCACVPRPLAGLPRLPAAQGPAGV